MSEHFRWQVRRAAFCCSLSLAGYAPPNNFTVSFPVSQKVLDLVKTQLPSGFSSTTLRGDINFYNLNLSDATTWFLAARSVNKSTPLPGSSSGKNWVDNNLQAYLNVLATESSNGTYIRGYRQLTEYLAYHSSTRQEMCIRDRNYYFHLQTIA